MIKQDCDGYFNDDDNDRDNGVKDKDDYNDSDEGNRDSLHIPDVVYKKPITKAYNWKHILTILAQVRRNTNLQSLEFLSGPYLQKHL